MKNSIVFAILVVFAAIIGACSPSAATPSAELPPTLIPSTLVPSTVASTQTTSSDLAGKSWTLATLNGNAPVQGTEVTLSFTDTQLSGAACNGYGGDYTANGGTLTVQNVVATQKACTTPDGVMDQEQSYLSALEGAIHYQVTGDTLTLGTAANPSILTFTASTNSSTGAPTTAPSSASTSASTGASTKTAATAPSTTSTKAPTVAATATP